VSADPVKSKDRAAGPVAAMLGFWLAAVMLWWAFAFYRLPPAAPEWLVRARDVCFRTVGNGLPDAAGWLMLVLPPLGMLAVLLLGWGAEIRSALAVLRARHGGQALAALLAAAVAVEAGWVTREVRERRTPSTGSEPDRGPLPDHYPRLGRPLPAFALVDGEGRTFGDADLRGEVSVLTFAFAHCETICPATVRRVVEGSRSLESRPRVVVMSVDPWRDTPSSLAGAARRFGLADGDRFLGGPVEDVNAALDALGVTRARDPANGDVSHPALVYVVDADGRIAYALLAPGADWVAEAVRRARQPAQPEPGVASVSDPADSSRPTSTTSPMPAVTSRSSS
jgi:protein SCO1/2